MPLEISKIIEISDPVYTFGEVTDLLEEINTLLVFQGVKFELREEYAIEYLDEIRKSKRSVVFKKFFTMNISPRINDAGLFWYT